MEPRHEQEIQANSAASTTHDQEELKNPSKNKKKRYIIIRQDEDIQRTSTQKKLPDSPPKCGCQKSIQGNCTDEKSPEFPPKKAGYPPGYRFMPTDDELILEYLLKKINNEPIPIAEITPVYLKQNNPKALAETHPKLGENEWYFFTPRDRKYPNGSRPNRAADTGYWKATGADKPVRFKDKVIGFRKALVFYEGKPPKGEKTSWIMHEFRVNQPSRSKRSADDMRLDDWVLCRIYEKASRPNNRNRRADDPVEDDENPLQVNTDDNDENSGVELNNENASPVVDSSENLAAFDMPENLAIGQHSDDEFRSFGDHWLQPSLHSLLISPPHSMDEPALINGHLQSSILDYGLVNPVGQVQQNAFRTTYLNEHEQAFGFQQGNFDDAAAAGSWVQENSGTFQQLPSYFGPSSSRNNTTNLYDHSLMKVEDPYSGTVTNNPDYNQYMPRKRRI